MIKPRPNTDVSMILAMCYVLYKNDMYDKKFVRKNTVGFDKFIDYVLGKEDGIEKTPEWAEEICAVKAEAIERFAKTLAKERTMIMGGWAIQRAEHGEQVPWAIVTLSSMLGFIGLPGGGFGFGYHEGSGGSPKHQAVGLSGISSNISTKGPWDTQKGINIPVARIVDMLNNPGTEIDYNGKKVKYPDVKLVYWTGGNPFHHHQDRNGMIKAWKKIETFIVNEPFWTATARMADIVLPATTEVERTDIEVLGDYSLRGYVGMNQLIKPVGESKDDYEIFRELSKRFGLEKEYTDGKTQMQWIQGFYEDAMKKAKEMKLPMAYPSFEEFWEKGYLGFPKPTKESMQWVKMADFRKNPRRNRLGTPSGKIELFSKTIDKMNYKGCRGHVTWFEPNEWLGSPKAKIFPFHLLSPHPKYRLHSQLNNTALRHVYEIKEREPISIHPVNAKAKGIKNGDIVRVFNSRGEILAGALVTNHVSIDTVRIHEGAWYNPLNPAEEKTLCIHGDVNVLTQDIPTSKLAQGSSANTALVDFEKYTGVAPKVSIFNAPNIKH
jgi:trimethylamine-N-oxide reductase (cytochrome c)